MTAITRTDSPGARVRRRRARLAAVAVAAAAVFAIVPFADARGLRTVSVKPGALVRVNGTDIACLAQGVAGRSLLCLRTTTKGPLVGSYTAWLTKSGQIVIGRIDAQRQLQPIFGRAIRKATGSTKVTGSRLTYTVAPGDVVRVLGSEVGCHVSGSGKASTIECAARADAAGHARPQTYGIRLNGIGRVQALRFDAGGRARSIFTRSSGGKGSVAHLNLGDSVALPAAGIGCNTGLASQGSERWGLLVCAPLPSANGTYVPGSQAFYVDDRDTIAVFRYTEDGSPVEVFRRAPNVRGTFSISTPRVEAGRHIVVDVGDELRVVGTALTCVIDRALDTVAVHCARADARGHGIPGSYGAQLFAPGVAAAVRFDANRQPRRVFPSP